jgi:hypothetical protein
MAAGRVQMVILAAMAAIGVAPPVLAQDAGLEPASIDSQPSEKTSTRSWVWWWSRVLDGRLAAE